MENMGPVFRHFPQKVPALVAELQRLGPRYVVVDLAALGIRVEDAPQSRPDGRAALPPNFPPKLLQFYPWRERPVLRAGRYVVFDTSPAARAGSIRSSPVLGGERTAAPRASRVGPADP
jgi:hypothetical protein